MFNELLRRYYNIFQCKRKYSICVDPSAINIKTVFETIKNKKSGFLESKSFLELLKKTGIQENDPRIHKMAEKLKQSKKEIDVGEFEKLISQNNSLITKSLTQRLIIPDFSSFCNEIENIYESCRTNTKGNIATYIPALAKANPKWWAVSLCTVDGQMFSLGDYNVPFSLQSCSKPISYALALELLGTEIVHKYVGQEPSGQKFNKLILDKHSRPHNPMINSGAIMICALINTLANLELSVEEKLKFATDYFIRVGGHRAVNLNNDIFLSERETGNKNYALGYYMRTYGCFPKKADFWSCMDYYFKSCSLEVTSDTGAVMAATLANHGMCPITNEKLIKPTHIKHVLSLMYTCGMYDYSGHFAFKVGLPGKSGVSGGLLLVIPDVMGICTFSPPLDALDCSSKAVQFCDELINKFSFHKYDSLKCMDTEKINPTICSRDHKATHMAGLFISAASGDLEALERYKMCGMDMSISDYDGRTALHVAAAEGHSECVRFLLQSIKVDVKDRWGHTPMGEAESGAHKEVVELLKEIRK